MRILIANRGEVAVRIIRACEELGYTSILLHSTPDKNTIAYRLANEKIEIPGTSATETYLNQEKVVQAAKKVKADLIHPGFGFLSENADFVELLEKENLNFVGPTSETIRMVGNKIHAKDLAKKVSVPTVPAYTGKEKDIDSLLKEAQKIGFPCIIKAASGGGGKGMKVAQNEREFVELYPSAKREALSAFGSDIVFIEKYLEQPRHIEVQIFFDTKGVGVHLYERECSIQRRHQKIFEETPSMALNQKLRDQITSSALKIGKACGYTNAGTVEFLLDRHDKFYFMELNTRLQVEHTVTEATLGIDLVKWQFAIALGKDIPLSQEQIVPRGHALEVRVYAENPAQEFLPSTGVIAQMNLPTGPQRRFDFGYAQGDTITPYYDPMIGKVITWAATRDENLKRMNAVLSELVIFGVHTNIEFLKSVLNHFLFQTSQVNTRFLEDEYKNGYVLPELTKNQIQFAEQSRGSSSEQGDTAHSTLNYNSPWLSS
jgi:3-methylcrotonyl-CoA carboxylase alpha subunit